MEEAKQYVRNSPVVYADETSYKGCGKNKSSRLPKVRSKGGKGRPGARSLAIRAPPGGNGTIIFFRGPKQGNADGENPKNLGGWLWVIAAPLVAYFEIQLSRGKEVAQELLGVKFANILSSDRYPGYAWRRMSQGTKSKHGSLFVGRLLTVIETLRLQDRNVLEYLTQACEAARAGTVAPTLLPRSSSDSNASLGSA